jgi:hypothetical protein
MNNFDFAITSHLKLSVRVRDIAEMPGHAVFVLTETDLSENKYKTRVVYSLVLESSQIDELLGSFARLKEQNEIPKTQGRDSRS